MQIVTVPKVNEGQASYHDYQLLGDNGSSIGFVEYLQYKLSDGETDLLPWTVMKQPIKDVGTISIPGEYNRLTDVTKKRRILTILLTHDDGKHLTHELVYQIRDLKGITIDTTVGSIE